MYIVYSLRPVLEAEGYGVINQHTRKQYEEQGYSIKERTEAVTIGVSAKDTPEAAIAEFATAPGTFGAAELVTAELGLAPIPASTSTPAG